MKITPEVVRQFEEDQAQDGTETAIYNILHNCATQQLIDLGVQSVQTINKRKERMVGT